MQVACTAHATCMKKACYICQLKYKRFMPDYPKPEHSRREVNRAGEILMNPAAPVEEMEDALVIINNWRASHNFPLNTFQMRLRRLARGINPENLVAQRIKRLSSIKLKLERFEGMNLAQIQDIGGCRAIMRDISEVDALVNIYEHQSRGIKHKLHASQDYIQKPKASGYRGVHLIELIFGVLGIFGLLTLFTL